MHGRFGILQVGLFSTILFFVCACQSAKPTYNLKSDTAALIGRYEKLDAACQKQAPDETSTECKERDTTANELASVNYCLGEHVFSSDVKSVWAPCTEPPAIEALERKWGSFYGNCDHAEYGPARDKACSAADVVSKQLNDQGYCYGEFASSHSTEDWLPCKKKPERLTGMALKVHDLKTEWSVQDTNCTAANDPSFAKKACAIRDNDATQLTNQGLCLNEADYGNVWAECPTQSSSSSVSNVNNQNSRTSDFDGDSTELAAAKINMLPLMQDLGFVEKVYGCGLRSASWYAAAKSISTQHVQTEMMRERLTESEQQQRNAYVLQHVGDIALSCAVVSKAPMLADLDQAIR